MLFALSSTNAFALELHTSIVINASPEQVWTHFADFESYGSWNPFIKELRGTVAQDEQLRVRIDGMKFTPKVKRYHEGRELQWLGRLLMPGIFDGRHSFELIDTGDGTTTFVQKESFKGLLVPMLKKKLLTETKAGFEAMNSALKSRVEAAVASH